MVYVLFDSIGKAGGRHKVQEKSHQRIFRKNIRRYEAFVGLI